MCSNFNAILGISLKKSEYSSLGMFNTFNVVLYLKVCVISNHCPQKLPKQRNFACNPGI